MAVLKFLLNTAEGTDLVTWTDISYIFHLQTNELNHLIKQCLWAAALLKDERTRRSSDQPRKLTEYRSLVSCFRDGSEKKDKISRSIQHCVDHMQETQGQRLPSIKSPDFPSEEKYAQYPARAAAAYNIKSLTQSFPPERQHVPSGLEIEDEYDGGLVNMSEAIRSKRLTSYDLEVLKFMVVAASARHFEAREREPWFLPTALLRRSNPYFGDNGDVLHIDSVWPLCSATPTSHNVCLTEIQYAPDITYSTDVVYALERLQKMKVITIKKSFISISPTVAMSMFRRTPQDMLSVMKQVLLAFPKHGETEPKFYTSIGKDMLPLVESLLPQLWAFWGCRGYNVDSTLRPEEMYQFTFDTLLSATQFGKPAFKAKALLLAQQLAYLEMNRLDMLRAHFRKHAIHRSFCPRERKIGLPLLTTDLIVNERSNAIIGELMQCRAQDLLNDRAEEAVIREALPYTPLSRSHISWQERCVMKSIDFMIGRCLRFQGDFKGAQLVLSGLGFAHGDKSSRYQAKFVYFYSEVLSELGEFNMALELLNDAMHNLTDKRVAENGVERRLCLSIESVRLTKAIRMKTLTNEDLDPRIEIYEMMEKDYRSRQPLGLVAKTGLLAVLCGLAIVHQLKDRYEESKGYWGKAESLSRECWPDGFAMFLVLFSRSMLERRHRPSSGGCDYERAVILWNKIGRRPAYYLTGLGTVWLDHLGDEQVQLGMDRLVPRHHER